MNRFVRSLALLALLAVARAETPPVDPPAPADLAERARLSDALFPSKPAADADFAATLKAARAAGITEERLLEAEVYRALMHRVKSSDCLALAVRLEKAAPAWKGDDAVLIDSPVLADALSHALRALHALRSGNDVAKFRAEAAEAVWRATKLADLIGELETARSREALEASPAFRTLSRAVAEGDEDSARKVFPEAFWAAPPVSCDLAVEKLDALRDARADSAAAKAAPPAKGVAAFTPERRAPATAPAAPESAAR